MELADDETALKGSRRGEYREYEPHVRDLIALSGKWDLFPHLGIPRSTAGSWVKTGYQGLDEKLTSFGDHYLALSEQFDDLKQTISTLNARVGLLSDSRYGYSALRMTRRGARSGNLTPSAWPERLNRFRIVRFRGADLQLS